MRAREKNQQRERRRHSEGERVRSWLLTSRFGFKKHWGFKTPLKWTLPFTQDWSQGEN